MAFVSQDKLINEVSDGKRRSLLEVIKEKFPLAHSKWDGWDYTVYSCLSFDDDASIMVYLKNKDGKWQRLTIYV